METINKVNLTEEKETLFITLMAKAKDSNSKHSILHDKTAYDIVNTINYDFAKFKDDNDSLTVVRAKQYDDWISEFINNNADAVILYLGYGLDTRISRINLSSNISWFDLDYPEVINVRKTFYSEQDNYHMIEASITDSKWLDAIPCDRPTLILAEGVFEYLYPEEVKVLLNRLTDYFLHGQIMFDVISSFARESAKKKLKNMTGAEHKWAVDNLSEIDILNPKMKRIKELPLFKSEYVRKLPMGYRSVFALASLFPRFKNILRLVCYQF